MRSLISSLIDHGVLTKQRETWRERAGRERREKKHGTGGHSSKSMTVFNELREEEMIKMKMTPLFLPSPHPRAGREKGM